MTRATRVAGRLGWAFTAGVVLVASGGCATAGLAAAPLLSAVQAVADRAVERTLPADLATAWAASVNTFGRMGVTFERLDPTGDVWVLEGRGQTIHVSARLEPVTQSMTRVKVRVEAGNILADKQTAETMVAQLLATIGSAAASELRRDAETVRAVSALTHELQELRSNLARERVGLQPSAPPLRSVTGQPSAAKQPSDGTPVFVVPASYGHVIGPTIGGVTSPPVPPVSRTENRHEAQPLRRLDGMAAAPMTRVETLAPVQAMPSRSPEP
jgi:hypothetical protein